MADDEGGDASESKSSKSSKSNKDATSSVISANKNNQLVPYHREIWNRGISPSTGPRSLHLRRTENGFGFTLRHFIVYPPESYAILARDRRLGVGLARTLGDEPMDTIFVKEVRDRTPASAAGLHTGDRLVAVNGRDIAGLPYARVIQLITRAGPHLHLLVVPKENDLIQLYFSETAHNPETNQRPCPRSPEPVIPCGMMNACGDSRSRPYGRRDTTPAYHFEGASQRVLSPTRPFDAERRSSEGNNERKLSAEPALGASPSTDTSSCGSDSAYGGVAMARARFLGGYESSDSSTKDSQPTCDDSLIMSRLRKSVQEKERFMNQSSQVDDSMGAENRASTTTWTSHREQPAPSLDRISECEMRPVATRARHFERDATSAAARKTELHRSELSRLVAKHDAFGVAGRRREYELRAQADRQRAFAGRETRSLESAQGPPVNLNPSSGNRIIPIGSKKLHCDPPADFTQLISKSDELRNYDSKTKPVVRKESYLAACSKPTITKPEPIRCALRPNKLQARLNGSLRDVVVATRPNRLSLPTDVEQMARFGRTVSRKEDQSLNSAEPSLPSDASRTEKTDDNDDDKATRRTSYLNAMTIDSEYEFSDGEPTPAPKIRPVRKWRAPQFPGDIQRLRRFFEDLSASGAAERGILGSRKGTDAIQNQDQHSIIKEGAVLCKVTQIDGKKASDRSWKPCWLVLKGPILCLYKERRESLSTHTETPATFDRCDLGASCDRIDVRCAAAEVASDYTKRRHVLRLNAPSAGAELLLQADDHAEMARWVNALRQQALLPQDDPPINLSSDVSPVTCNKTSKKITSLRNRSPTGDSPSSKTRKSAPAAELQPPQTSPKSCTWKTKMAKQFRRIQQGPTSPAAHTASYAPGATIGVPLESCPSSSFSECVPLLVEICTNIVEAKGLEIIGIYRVPGNTAAVTSLTEAVNRGLDASILEQDARWTDVNVISSLLKSFFRKLPDALLTAELYPLFIKADKADDPVLRMITIRKLIHDLPDHNFETLKYLMFHLKKVVAHSFVNKMEARNLAIVFGPTLVRCGEDMLTMVTDMSHQCRIVESLIVHVDWCFGDGSLADLKANIPEVNVAPELEASSNPSLLLNNIRKVEGNMQSPVTAKDIVTTIIGAANRKMQKATTKHLSSTRKSHTSHSNSQQPMGSSSEDMLSATNNCQKSEKQKTVDKKEELKADESERTSMQYQTKVPTSNNNQENCIEHANNNSNNWTYANLTATTQERIRRFEQETKAMLQRELNRQKRLSESIAEECEKDKTINSSKQDSKNHNSSSFETRLTDSNSYPSSKCTDPVMCENPPLIVVRRNLPAVNGKSTNPTNNLKRMKTTNDFPEDSSIERSNSLNSLNVDRNSSHVSDDGDLLMSLTSTFDKKLKSLLVEEDETESEKRSSRSRGEEDQNEEQKLPTPETDQQTFRDPSLHRSLEKCVKHDAIIMGGANEPSDGEVWSKANAKLRRCESLKGATPVTPTLVKIRRAGSLRQQRDATSRISCDVSRSRRGSDSPLTKSEKTDANMAAKRRQQHQQLQQQEKKSSKVRRKGSGRRIRRRHTVGGTKDFDKFSWLRRHEHEKENRKERRTSSPDLSATKMADFVVEFVVKPRSLIAADPSFISRLLNIPLESHV